MDTAKAIAVDNFTNMSNSLAFDGKPIKKFYDRQLDYAHLKLKSGAYSIDEVIRDTARKIRENGLHSVEYKGNRRINIESAVRRNVMGSLNRANDEMSQANARALGTNLFEVSAHYNARPDHAEWQGGVYYLGEPVKGYKGLARVTGFGTVTGLEGVNCRHQKFPFIDGISTRAYTGEEIEALHTPTFTYNGVEYTGYEATQHQRKIEARMRVLKREFALTKDKTVKKIITQSAALYEDFSEKAGLKLQTNRFVA